MNNLKVALIALILLILIITGFYYYYRTRVTSVDLTPSPFASPQTNIRESTSSAQATSSAQNLPAAGMEDDLNLQTIISITSPRQAATVSSPLTVKGYANVTSQVVEVNIKDSNGKILGSGRASACLSFTGCEFQTNIIFARPSTATGTIEAYSKSTVDGSPTNVTSFDINF